jgi:hypothetical protein
MTKRARPRVVTLREDVVHGGSLTVDREKGEIRGVKILGWESTNRRRYLPEAGRAARGLYEGRAVNVDHFVQAGDNRSAYDRLGKLQDVEVRADGLYGTLVVLKSHPMAERVFEAAERMPDAFGLSHNAEGRGHTDSDGIFVVEEITRVNSVDLVADPATNKSLSESKTITTTPRKMIESGKLTPAAKKALLEMAKDCQEMEEPMPVVAADPADGRQLLAQAVGLLAQSGDSADHDLAAKLMKLLKPDEPVEEEEEDEEKPVEKEDEEKPVEESRKAVQQLREELNVRDLVEDAGITFGSSAARRLFVRSLVPLAAADRKALIEDRKAQAPGKGNQDRPRSVSPRPVQEAQGAGNTLKFEGDNAAQKRLNFLRGAG